jgi:hypothetical protein
MIVPCVSGRTPSHSSCNASATRREICRKRVRSISATPFRLRAQRCAVLANVALPPSPGCCAADLSRQGRRDVRAVAASPPPLREVARREVGEGCRRYEIKIAPALKPLHLPRGSAGRGWGEPCLTDAAREAAPGRASVSPLRWGPSVCRSGHRGEVRRWFHANLLPQNCADLIQLGTLPPKRRPGEILPVRKCCQVKNAIPGSAGSAVTWASARTRRDPPHKIFAHQLAECLPFLLETVADVGIRDCREFAGNFLRAFARILEHLEVRPCDHCETADGVRDQDRCPSCNSDMIAEKDKRGNNMG